MNCARPSNGLQTDPQTSARLGRIRQRGTAPELAVRRLVTILGHRYRIENRDLPGSPDLANRRRRWAIFVHGCYWHSHRGCVRATIPTRNRAFWESKFEANRARDARAVRALLAMDFRVITLWECELANPDAIVRRLRRELTVHRAAKRPS